MKYGLLTFPGLYDMFHTGKETRFSQRLEPSVLYVSPKDGQKVFVQDNQPRDDIDLYLCSVYTRGWNEFKRFAQKVGREKIIAGGYHVTALPQDALKFAHKVIWGYCGNIDEIIQKREGGIFKGDFEFTQMDRSLLDMPTLCQVYPDITPKDVNGSMVSSVGCPYDCEFCSTPQMSGKKMRVSQLDYVAREIEDLKNHGVTTVFIRDESFATNKKIKEISELFKDQFRMVYSFGTGSVMASREDLVDHLVKQGWHSLNLGLEDVGVSYNKNKNLKQATDNLKKHRMGLVMSFIVNDEGKTKDEARANYYALFEAFLDHGPSQVCANFLMPLPGTGLWQKHKEKFSEEDFDKFDSKTPLFTRGELAEWHKRMLVAVQIKYYRSELYNRTVRNFECGDNLHLRIEELEKEFALEDVAWEDLLEIK